MSISHRKIQSVGKVLVPRGDRLKATVLKTLKTCSDLVGSTLGPGGMNVIIERQETGLPPVVTKDGVTVFKSLGFHDPVQQIILETAREASIKTAAEAGDGTTTATILSELLTSNIQKLVDENPHWSPQFVSKEVENIFKDLVTPFLESQRLECSLQDKTDSNGVVTPLRKRSYDVARISANGDKELAEAVMKCFDIVGDSGNVTITEASGESKYEVEKIEGFPIAMGYEESCGVYWPEFVNDKATQQCVLNKPIWILYHGQVRDFNEVLMPAELLAQAASQGKANPNIVVVATGFSDQFLANCASTFATKNSVRVYPLLAPRDRSVTAQLDFLHDVAALTGAVVFDPLTRPLNKFEDLKEFGWHPSGPMPTLFEASRFRCSIIGRSDEDLIIDRVEALEKQMDKQSSGQYDKDQLKERIAKLTSGIARLYVRGPSNGEVKERRDRAEDAVCAVRSALKLGALPGGGYTWISLANKLKNQKVLSSYQLSELGEAAINSVLVPSIEELVERLYTNAGYTKDEARGFMAKIGASSEPKVYDLQKQKLADPLELGLLDSYSAAFDALRNAISVAGRLGTCGGAVAFARDVELERQEAAAAIEYDQNTGRF